MTTHLALDAVGGTVFLATAVMARSERPAVRATLAGAGLLFLTAAVCTKTRRSRAGQEPSRFLRPDESPMSHYAHDVSPVVTPDHAPDYTGAEVE
jgi:hypothetical protein